MGTYVVLGRAAKVSLSKKLLLLMVNFKSAFNRLGFEIVGKAAQQCHKPDLPSLNAFPGVAYDRLGMFPAVGAI